MFENETLVRAAHVKFLGNPISFGFPNGLKNY